MVAGCQHVYVRIEQFFDNLPGNPETGCGILAIGDHQVHVMRGNQRRQQFPNRPASGFADNIADKKNFHYLLISTQVYLAKLETRVSRMTVTLICPGYVISVSIFLIISLHSITVSLSEIFSFSTMMRISRPA